MNSPRDPGSPTDSASTSGTPPPEEAVTQPEQRSSGLGIFQLANQITATFSGSSKRRNPSGGSGNAAAPTRDSKLRKREGATTRSNWEARGEVQAPRKEKDELVDTNVVEYLRKEIQDPFEVSTSTSTP
ncbi:hypothetical protein AN958_00659 [Leucoagaricus sp. SymC.cos]|nr:hypothetical protein AN958_00659 [Leucoagaricus sp. SymC.cos]